MPSAAVNRFRNSTIGCVVIDVRVSSGVDLASRLTSAAASVLPAPTRFTAAPPAAVIVRIFGGPIK